MQWTIPDRGRPASVTSRPTGDVRMDARRVATAPSLVEMQLLGYRLRGLSQPCFSQQTAQEVREDCSDVHHHAGQALAPVELFAAGRVHCYRRKNLGFARHDSDVFCVTVAKILPRTRNEAMPWWICS